MSAVARWAPVVARVLLGLFFLFAAVMGFAIAPPPAPGLAGAFNDVMYHSHFGWFVSGAQLVMGLLLVSGRYVPLGLVMMGAFFYNSIAFHVTMMPAALPIVLVFIVLWVVAAWPFRRAFGRLFTAAPQTTRDPT